MAHAIISTNLPPNIDPTKAPIAFGERALPKLNEELQSEDLLTRQRALMALCDLVHDPEFAYQAISIGFLESLKTLLCDEDRIIRQKTTEIFYLLANHNVGRDGFLRSDVILPLSQLLDDPVDLCRVNMHKAFAMLSEFPYGALGLVQAGLVPMLVKKLETEVVEVQELILDTLHFCLNVEACEAIRAGAVSTLKAKLTHPSVAIRSKAAYALMGICVPLVGKQLVCDEGVIPILVDLLGDADAEVRANAAGALMYAIITTPGKFAALHSCAIPLLLPLVKDKLSKVRLNALKCLTILSETSGGRKSLLSQVEVLRELLEDPNEAVQKAAAAALAVVQWKP
ncbi:radial spoke head 14 homolog [Ambystoma mexicanum]|uniref:radial spoke head 14 homolog n=1 Tax=Ambystoma mexicanum TaxID=8296 RepID=UPI0037E76352